MFRTAGFAGKTWILSFPLVIGGIPFATGQYWTEGGGVVCDTTIVCIGVRRLWVRIVYRGNIGLGDVSTDSSTHDICWLTGALDLCLVCRVRLVDYVVFLRVEFLLKGMPACET